MPIDFIFDTVTPGIRTRFDARCRDLPGDGKNWILNNDLICVDSVCGLLRCPVGMATDGPSIPQIVENIIPREGEHFSPCVFHDGAYADNLERFEDGLWQPFTFVTQHECDDLLNRIMEASGTPMVRRETIYTALRAAGHLAFAQDRSEAAKRGPRPRVSVDERMT